MHAYSPSPLRGLYAITPDPIDDERLMQALQQLLPQKPALLQYRNKTLSPQASLERARGILGLCRMYRVPLIINDSLEMALELEADGVHLGEDDGALEQARARLGPSRLLGASAYNDVDRAYEAVRAGVDYIAFGAFFPSGTKPLARHCPLSVLEKAGALGVTRVAIGGLTVDNAAPVLAAGADMLAVVGDLFSANDIACRARQWQALFELA
jgi:thiamine-phosphate pyrophosphorylase